MNSTAQQGHGKPFSFRRMFCLAATVQVVWFYLATVPSAMDLVSYEQGSGPMPFQGRMLLVLPLRWAHANMALQHLAAAMSAMPGWFGRARHPEGLLEAVLDVMAVAGTCWIARRLYRVASPLGLLTPFVVPLTLVMVTATYAFNAVHPLRFVYDLPSLGLFSLGLEIIFFRRSITWFAALFAVATVNRETSLFLLVLEGLTLWADTRGTTDLAAIRAVRRRSAVMLFLLGAWIGWHLWLGRHFAGNPSAAAPRLLLNAGTVFCPISWPQLLSVGAFCGPLLIVSGQRIPNARLRTWRWVFPLWLGFMAFYGLLIETRIFGELIAYAACAVALLAEQEIVGLLRRGQPAGGEWIRPRAKVVQRTGPQRRMTRCVVLPTVNWFSEVNGMANGRVSRTVTVTVPPTELAGVQAVWIEALPGAVQRRA